MHTHINTYIYRYTYTLYMSEILQKNYKENPRILKKILYIRFITHMRYFFIDFYL